MYTTTSTATGQNYTYDGFGNMTMTTKPGYGAAPQFTAAADTTNNHVNGFGYDANGNVTQMGSQTFTYDVENRLGGNYSYDASNRRVWDGSNYTMWTLDGRRIGRYTASPSLWDHWVGATRVQEWILIFSVVDTTAYLARR